MTFVTRHLRIRFTGVSHGKICRKMSSRENEFSNLRQGHPAEECLQGCSKMLLDASMKVLSDPSLEQDMFQYGHGCRGPEQFRGELARFLSEQYQAPVNNDNLLVTCGASQGLHLVASTLFTKDNPVFLEELSYYHSINLFQNLMQMRTIPVAMDEEGIKPDVFDKLLTEERARHSHLEITKRRPFWAMAYLIPTFHNPTGICYSPARCKEMIRLARKHRILLACDDVYNLLYYNDLDKPPERLLSYDNINDSDFCGSVASVGTFTKILGPGLRLGWIEALPPVMDILVRNEMLLSGGCINQYTAYIMAAAIKLGLETENVQRLRKLYHSRMNQLLTALRQFLPANCSVYMKSQGGYFVWISLPEGLDTEHLQKMAVQEYKVDFLPGIRCSPQQRFRNGIRLSMSTCDEELIEPGVKRLCEAIKRYTADCVNTA